MDKQTDNMDLLDLIVAPCFCVRDNRIIQYNQAASRLFLEENAELLPLLTTGAEEYRKFSGGSLYLTLNISGQIMGAAVERRGGLDYFILESEKESSELRALALASRELRSPLSSVIITAERICSAAVQEDPGLQQQAAMLNKSLHQLLRIVGNMSAAGAPPSRQETCEIGTVFQEIFEKARTFLSETGISLDYQGPDVKIYCLADAQELERAVMNILSNCVKFSRKDGKISACLTRQGKMLCLKIQDNGTGIPENIRGSIFRRYLRQPAIEDGRYGIGLGMVLIRSAAANHGGTVLIDHPAQGGTRVTLTMAIRQDSATLCSPVMRIDYAGEKDHALIELSDVLPASAFLKESSFEEPSAPHPIL